MTTLVLLLLSQSFQSPAWAPDASELIKASLPSVVVLEVDRGKSRPTVAAAFLVHPDGYLLTCNHVVRGARSQTATLYNGKVLKARLLLQDPGHDLALLALDPDYNFLSLDLAAVPPLQGQDILVIGHPLGYRWTVTRGILSALSRELDVPGVGTLSGLLQIDAAIGTGSSGSPVLALSGPDRGKVLGMVCALHDGGRGIAFAVPASTIQRFLTDNLPRVPRP